MSRDPRVYAGESVLALAGMESWGLEHSGTQPGESGELSGERALDPASRCKHGMLHPFLFYPRLGWTRSSSPPDPDFNSKPFQQSPPAATAKKQSKSVLYKTTKL